MNKLQFLHSVVCSPVHVFLIFSEMLIDPDKAFAMIFMLLRLYNLKMAAI